jgi:hypothetical protein
MDMKKLALTAALGAGCLALAACGQSETNTAGADLNAAGNEAAGAAGGAEGNQAGGATASASFPSGARIVEEGGTTYRIDADGTRVALGPTDSRIVVEKGVRYRVDPDGNRVRIDTKGVAIDLPDVDLPDVTPDVDIGTNEKGNPDIDVKGDKDGDKGPN